MVGEGEEPKKNKPRKEKVRVSEDRELTEKRKGASSRLFVLEIDSDLDESGDEPKKYALELFSAKVKKQTGSKNHLYLPSKVTIQIFPPIKANDLHR